MNQDAQAIVEAFYFDTFAAMGVDLAAVSVGSPEHDLSDRSAELKGLVRVPMDAMPKSLGTLKAHV
jgi:hypothetical protein